jgi:adenylate kinase
MRTRGEPLRPDDNPEVLKQRLTAYQAQTAPLVDYYRSKEALRAVDGMASISDVAAAIGRALADTAFRPTQDHKPAVGASKPSAGARRPAGRAQKVTPGRKSASGKAAQAKKLGGKVKAAKRAAKTTLSRRKPAAGARKPAMKAASRRLPERRKKAEKLGARGG